MAIWDFYTLVYFLLCYTTQYSTQVGSKNMFGEIEGIKDKRVVMKNKRKLKHTRVFIDDDLTSQERENSKRIRKEGEEKW